MANIDYDRGVEIRQHPSGVRVFMYNDEPGVFLNAFGNEVAPELAHECGFDTERLGKERLKRERLAAAKETIEREFDAAQKLEVVTERSGFRVVHIGLGRHNLLDPDDNRLNTRPLTLEEANTLLLKMAPAPVAEKKPSKGGE